MPASLVRSFCRVCTAACGIVVEVDGDRVVRVRGDADHPLSQGYTCSKGRALPQAHHHPQRLETPLVRANGTLARAGWDDALDDLAARLRAILDESGPAAVGVFLGGGGYMDAAGYWMARRVPAALRTPSVYSDMTIDVIAKTLVSEMVAGVPGLMTRPDFERCRLVLYVGTNPLVSHGHTSMLNSPTARMREMTARGEVWVVDPRATETARHATRHLAVRPSSDHALLAFLVREVLREGADARFLREHAQGVDALAAAVAPFDAARASDETGLAPRDLQALLTSVRRARRLCVDTGTGISMSPTANATQWLAWALMIATGSLDRPGGACVNPGFLTRFDRLEMPPAPEDGWRRAGPASRPELRTVGGEYACAAMADEIEAGNLRALLNFGGNLVACLPGTERTRAALAKLDVLASFDVIANETTAISTHVLPTKGQLERADLPYAVDIAFPRVATQYTPPAVAPAGERRSFWQVLALLGERIGVPFDTSLDPHAATDDDALARIAASAGRDLDALRDGHYEDAGAIPIGWVEARADAIGGYRLAPPALVAELRALEERGRTRDARAPLVLLSRRQRHHINARFTELRDRPAILASARDAKDAGLVDGAEAVVRSAHGELRGTLRIDPTLPPGALCVPHGFPGAHNVNQLTSPDDVDALTGMPRFSGLPVSLHAAV